MNEHADVTTARRQDTILELVRAGAVRSQAELQHLLRKRGIAVTQPTLSRDVRELGLAKTPQGYLPPDGTVTAFAPAEVRAAKLDRVLRRSAVSVQAAGSLVVIKTPPAAAQPVARALDETALPEVAGTIAGDDTVFVATSGDRAARALARQLMTSLGKRRLGMGA
jgi:transcriptional regulator of arginine metabolism